MNIQISKEKRFDVLQISGEIDLHCSPEARRHIMSVLDEDRHLLIDLSEVNYIDSSAIACLVEGLQHAKGNSLNFGLSGVREMVMEVLKLTRLDQAFPVYPSLEIAKMKFASREDGHI